MNKHIRVGDKLIFRSGGLRMKVVVQHAQGLGLYIVKDLKTGLSLHTNESTLYKIKKKAK